MENSSIVIPQYHGIHKSDELQGVDSFSAALTCTDLYQYTHSNMFLTISVVTDHLLGLVWQMPHII